MANFPSESGHWYEQDGTPAYTVPNKSRGGMRPTRITDAKKLGLLPSFSGVEKVLAKPGLENWKIEQALMSALTLPRDKDEPLDAFMARAREDAKQQAIQAAEKGKFIHANIEAAAKGKPIDPEAEKIVAAVWNTIYQETGRRPEGWIAEETFANTELGYGGMVDLNDHGYWVLDVKGKDFDDPAKVKAWDENGMQLAAYRQGLRVNHNISPIARCANVFFSRNNPGLVAWIEWKEEDLERCWQMFKHCLELWKLQKRYRPEAQ